MPTRAPSPGLTAGWRLGPSVPALAPLRGGSRAGKPVPCAGMRVRQAACPHRRAQAPASSGRGASGCGRSSSIAPRAGRVARLGWVADSGLTCAIYPYLSRSGALTGMGYAVKIPHSARRGSEQRYFTSQSVSPDGNGSIMLMSRFCSVLYVKYSRGKDSEEI